MLLANPFRPDARVLKEAESLASSGYQITILCWDRQAAYPSQETISHNIQILRVQNAPSAYGIGLRQVRPLLGFWRAAWNLLNILRPKLVHAHDFDTLPVGFWWSKRHHASVIYDAHEHYAELIRPRLKGFIGRSVYQFVRYAELFHAKYSDAIITVDHHLAQGYQTIMRSRKQAFQVLVIGHYPRRDHFRTSAPVFTSSELNLLYMGRLSQDRGLFVYLEILRRLSAAGIPARLHLAGTFTPLEEQDRFLSAAQELMDRITLHGWAPYQSMPGLLKSADVGLALLQPIPRYLSAMPVKIFEYMAAGLPVLASDFPFVRQVLEHADCGALIDPADSIAAAEILQTWYKHPDKPRKLGFNGRQAVINEYNWETIADGLGQLYAHFLN